MHLMKFASILRVGAFEIFVSPMVLLGASTSDLVIESGQEITSLELARLWGSPPCLPFRNGPELLAKPLKASLLAIQSVSQSGWGGL